MISSSWEHQREVRAALRTIVSDPQLGAPALSSAQSLSNLLKDLLPDAPRETSVLVAAAEARLADFLLDHVRQGMDIDTASSLTASAFAARAPFTPDACHWVVGELSVALGLAPPEPGADARPTAPGPGGAGWDGIPFAGGGAGAPSMARTSSAEGAIAGPGGGADVSPGAGGSPGYGSRSGAGGPAGGAVGAGYGPYPVGGGATVGNPGYLPYPGAGAGPGYGPYSGTGRASGAGLTRGAGRRAVTLAGTVQKTWAIAAVVAVAVIGGIAALAVSQFSGTGGVPSGPPAGHIGSVTTRGDPGSTGGGPASAPGSSGISIEPLSQIIEPDVTRCRPAATGGLGLTEVTNREFCGTKVHGIGLNAYQFATSANYSHGLGQLNSLTGFSSTAAGTTCPPPPGGSGQTGWHSNVDTKYPQRQGQILECYVLRRSKTFLIYLWTLPSQRVILLGTSQAPGSSSADLERTFADLQKWWAALDYG